MTLLDRILSDPFSRNRDLCISGMLGGGGGQGQKAPRLQGFRLQTSTYGNVIQIVYGRMRVAGFYLWAGDLVTNHDVVGGKGGANGGSSFYTYTLASQIGLCQGPITKIGRLWRMGNGLERRTAAEVANQWTIELGNFGQAGWTYLTNKHPGQDLGYTGIAWAAVAVEQLGTTAVPPQRTWEVFGLFPYSPADNIWDANPRDIIVDFLSNPRYGAVPQLPLDPGNFENFSNYCIANNIFLSPVFDQQQPASYWLGEGNNRLANGGGILEICNADCMFSNGALQIVPYGDTAVTANGVTWTPDLTPIYSLTDDDFIPGSKDEEPLVVTQENPADRYNIIKIEYIDVGNDYNISIVEAKDESQIQIYRERRDMPRAYHAIANGPLATFVANVKLQRMLWVQNQYAFQLPTKYFLLDPLDIVAITDPVLNLDAYPVRIVSIDEDDNYNLKVVAEDIGPNFSPGYPTQPAGGFSSPDPGLTPASINTPVFFEPGTALAVGDYEIWIALSGQNGSGLNGQQDWGGCNVWYSEDNNTFTWLGTQRNSAKMGTLLAALPDVGGNDTTSTLSVDLSESDGELLSTSNTLASDGWNAAFVDGEILTFANVAPGTDPFQFNLTDLYRGLYLATGDEAHAAGGNFVFLNNMSYPDPGIFRWQYRPGVIGQTIYFKFTSLNGLISAEEELPNVPSYAYTVQGTVWPLPTGDTWPGAHATVAEGATIAASNGSALKPLTFLFVAIQGGITGATEPTWPSQYGAKVHDGSVIWQNQGLP